MVFVKQIKVCSMILGRSEGKKMGDKRRHICVICVIQHTWAQCKPIPKDTWAPANSMWK